MADGFSAALANTAVTAAATASADIALATGDPGSAGTANPSSVTTRQSLAWGTASGGVIAITNTPTWSSWAGTSGEVVTDLATWSAPTGGTFGFSVQATASVTMHTGDTLTLTSLTVTIPTAS
jgi:hypothetical protein